MATEKNVKEISRKDFLKGVGKSVAGVTILGGIGGILTACGNEPAAKVEPPVPPAPAKLEPPAWPYTYVKLDGDKVAQRAYDAYKTGAG